ncbi:MAG TPA: phosphonoacetate hydrolase, partial [Verrucomicrobiota bacterium]|nr:phosphonoacetate hydrolase [Verrucomicrobiota bacterium]
LEDPSITTQVAEYLFALDGITEVLTREQAVDKLELAPDRIGDLVVLSGRDWVVGKSPEHHDLGVLHGGLRSHGGRYEEMVPFLFNRPLQPAFRRRAEADVRNFDIFDFTCNGLVT